MIIDNFLFGYTLNSPLPLGENLDQPLVIFISKFWLKYDLTTQRVWNNCQKNT